MPTKTPCNHTTTRWEGKLNLLAKVEFLHSDNGPRNRCKLRHFIPSKNDANKKWRENRESLVSNEDNRWLVLSVFRSLVKALQVIDTVDSFIATSSLIYFYRSRHVASLNVERHNLTFQVLLPVSTQVYKWPSASIMLWVPRDPGEVNVQVQVVVKRAGIGADVFVDGPLLKCREINITIAFWYRTQRPGGVLIKVLYREAPPRGPIPYPFIYHFFQKRHPFRIPFIGKRHPFHIPS